MTPPVSADNKEASEVGYELRNVIQQCFFQQELILQTVMEYFLNKKPRIRNKRVIWVKLLVITNVNRSIKSSYNLSQNQNKITQISNKT